MCTTNRIKANRLNSRRSTGPRTAAGKSAAAANATKDGLFSRRFVIEAVGESAEAWEVFRDAVVEDLDAAGVLELELAVRVAHVLWRTRRVGVYEAAAAATSPLPPHPDEVGPAAGDAYLPLPPAATAADKLARVRARLPAVRSTATGRGTALGIARRLAPAVDLGPLDGGPVQTVLDAAGDDLGFDRFAAPSPWDRIARDLGAGPAGGVEVAWTGELLLRAIGRAAAANGRTPEDVLGRVVAVLRADSESADIVLRRREAEEQELVEALLAEREAAAARAVYADDAVVQRVARAESHLSRELDRALAAFERVRAARGRHQASPADEGGLGSFCKTACRG